jgi:hypothetical protein
VSDPYQTLKSNEPSLDKGIHFMSVEIPLNQLSVSIHFGVNPKSGIYTLSHKLTKHITTNSWSPILFKGGRRKEEFFDFSDWAVLDYDAGERIEDAINTFSDCVHVIGTTKSHTEEKHRFRVCIPWEQRITDVRTFKASQKKFVEDHGSDPQCKDGARFYFPCKDIVSIGPEGFRVAVTQPTKELEEPKRDYSRSGFSSAVTFFMKNVIHEGRRNTQIYQVAKDLFRIGLDKQVAKQIILKAPTYRDTIVTPDLEQEIQGTINSAWRSVQ